MLNGQETANQDHESRRQAKAVGDAHSDPHRYPAQQSREQLQERQSEARMQQFTGQWNEHTERAGKAVQWRTGLGSVRKPQSASGVFACCKVMSASSQVLPV